MNSTEKLIAFLIDLVIYVSPIVGLLYCLNHLPKEQWCLWWAIFCWTWLLCADINRTIKKK